MGRRVFVAVVLVLAVVFLLWTRPWVREVATPSVGSERNATSESARERAHPVKEVSSGDRVPATSDGVDAPHENRLRLLAASP